MHLTELQRQLITFLAPNSINPALAGILTDGRRAVATDSFCLVETTALNAQEETGTDVLLSGRALKAIKLKDTAALTLTPNPALAALTTPEGTSYTVPVLDAEYPQYETIFPLPDAKHIEVRVNAKYLAEIALYLSKIADLTHRNTLTLRVYDAPTGHKPIVLTAEGNGHSVRAMLMPCIK